MNSEDISHHELATCFIQKNFKLLQTEVLFLAQNAPETAWQPGSAQTR